MINLFRPYIPEETGLEINKTLQSGQIAQGAKVEEFEREFCKLFNVKYALSLNSGTSALETAYDIIKLKEGDEVITTPLTCTATNISLLHRGVKIVWADVLEDTLCIDPLDVQAKITEKTKAIVQVHLGGVKADVGVQHIPVVSDACQALGIFNGDFTCCSFQAIKHITTGDGGMLVVESGGIAHIIKLLRWFGIDREREVDNNWKAYKTRMMSFDIDILGYKRQMNDICATMGLVGLRHYAEALAHRKLLFNIYRQYLSAIDGIKIIDGKENVYWLFTVLVENRDDFARMLYNAKVDTNLVQIRNDIYSVFGGERADLPTLNKIEDKYISLPIGTHVSEENVHYIGRKIQEGW